MVNDFPRISVITPSFNQAEFLERTMRSVLDQGYANLEYIVIDGGSTDGSVDLIRKHAERLTYWVSEPDRGQVDAINKGLHRASGDWLCWQNSDDVFFPGAFADLAKAASEHPEAGLIVGNMVLIDENDRPLRDLRYVTPDHGAMLRRLELNQVLLARARASLSSLARLLGYVSRPALGFEFSRAFHKRSGVLLQNVQSLIDHTNFLAGNINFELSAILGMINIEQNAIIRIFSVAAVIFMPPTLVASVYGMNFEWMPELGWSKGYPMALGFMLLSALGTYWFFKRRGWL